ncbi:MAG: glycosyltransferase [Myxococcaceae bacterium]
MISIPLTITAKNEERALGACLDSLLASLRSAEGELGVRIDPMVVLDECTDGTEEVARARGVRCVPSTGGKVEAQRRGLRPGPFQLFSDADITVTEDTLPALCEAMLGDEALRVAHPPKTPLPPIRRTPLARALHVYNLRRGFSSQRSWFSGKLFAIRGWAIPTQAELAVRAAGLPRSAFHDFAGGMRVDDVFLSRKALLEAGPAGIRETTRGLVRFRAPETLRGMYRYYRRLRRELERMDALFPETRGVHRAFGSRIPDLLRGSPFLERAAWHTFQTVLLGCRAAYVAERLYYDHVSSVPLEPWPAIAETKEP